MAAIAGAFALAAGGFASSGFAATTGTWTPSANGGTATAAGVTITASGIPNVSGAPTAGNLNTGNNSGFWNNPYGAAPTSASPALTFILAPDQATLTLTFTFSKPVDNPVFHFARIGGIVNGSSNTSVWTLSGQTSTGGSATLSLLSGANSQFQLSGTTFNRLPNVTGATTGLCVTGDATSTACGSVLVTGQGISSLTFTITWGGPVGGIGDGIDLAFSIPDTKAVYKKQSVGGTNSFPFTGTNGVGSSTLNTATANPQTSATYTITDNSQPISFTETAVAGYAISSTSCVDNLSTPTTSSLSTNTLTIAAANYIVGRTYTCTFVNNVVSDMSINLAGLPAAANVGVPYSGTFTCSNAASPRV